MVFYFMIVSPLVCNNKNSYGDSILLVKKNYPKEERISINQYVVFLSYTCNYIEILLSVLLTLIFEFEYKNSH